MNTMNHHVHNEKKVYEHCSFALMALAEFEVNHCEHCVNHCAHCG